MKKPTDKTRRRYLKRIGATTSAFATLLSGCLGGQNPGQGGNGGGGNASSGNGNESGGNANSTNGSTQGNAGSGGGEYTMTFATAYKIGSTKVYPVMQQQFKKNIEEASNGRISVNLQPNGVLGSGTELAKKVQSGTIEVGQFSMSNFSPYAPAVDLINLPYFTGTNEKFVNLITSDVWRTEVHKKVRQNGFEPLFYLVVDPRTIGVAKGKSKVMVPEDMQGYKHRIPGSDILKKTWNIVGANPTPIAWGETPTAIQEGVADSLHVSLEAYILFGFGDLISHATKIKMVEDAQVYAMNRKWFEKLPEDLKAAVNEASEKTFKQNLDQVPKSRQNSLKQLKSKGVEIHDLSDAQLQTWKDTVSYQRSVWDPQKKRLAGSMETFEKLEKATESGSKYEVPSSE